MFEIGDIVRLIRRPSDMCGVVTPTIGKVVAIDQTLDRCVGVIWDGWEGGHNYITEGVIYNQWWVGPDDINLVIETNKGDSRILRKIKSLDARYKEHMEKSYGT